MSLLIILGSVSPQLNVLMRTHIFHNGSNRLNSWYYWVRFFTITAREVMFTQIVFMCFSVITSVFPFNTTNTRQAEAVWLWGHVGGY